VKSKQKVIAKPNRNEMKIKEIPQNSFKIQLKNRTTRGKIVVNELT
jgi:hypothetical protein